MLRDQEIHFGNVRRLPGGVSQYIHFAGDLTAPFSHIGENHECCFSSGLVLDPRRWRRRRVCVVCGSAPGDRRLWRGLRRHVLRTRRDLRGRVRFLIDERCVSRGSSGSETKPGRPHRRQLRLGWLHPLELPDRSSLSIGELRRSHHDPWVVHCRATAVLLRSLLGRLGLRSRMHSVRVVLCAIDFE